jgi:hypothetical protein
MTDQSASWLVLDLGASCIEVVFAISLVGTLITIFGEILVNRTRIQNWKNEPREEMGSCEALESVCGRGPSLMWCCPTPAFGLDPFADGTETVE